jgi:hypothetical protein
MVNKFVAQRDVEYLHELLSQETDENRRTIFYACLRMQKKRLVSTVVAEFLFYRRRVLEQR